MACQDLKDLQEVQEDLDRKERKVNMEISVRRA
jgi:hypothetical protein